ncbi:MAG: hypothetical protein KA118_03325 [Verrucomicrobia bacterium]|nr:hypothetical protein [Verrucomicrobiota bacterium]
MNRPIPCLAAVLAAALLAGCAGYRLGPTAGFAAGARSVQIRPFQNQTLEPRLTEPFTSAMRKRVQQDGTYELRTREDADIIVTGRIIRYERSGVSFQPDDIITLRDYDVEVTVQLEARERATGRVQLDRQLTGRTTVRAGSDPASSERQALPILAEDFARKAVALLADGDW